MIKTKQIRDALLARLVAAGLFEKVMSHSDADLGAALEHLRDSPESLAVIVPGEDTLIHEITPGVNEPEWSEIRNGFELLVTSRNADMREGGNGDCADLKDDTVEALLWDNLSVPGLICLPLRSEPMIIETDDKRGREAWKITLEIRQHTLG